LAGTIIGRLVAYAADGRPTWDVQLSASAGRGIVAISPNPSSESQPIAFTVTLAVRDPQQPNPLTENNVNVAPLRPENLNEGEDDAPLPESTPQPDTLDITRS